MRLGTKYSITEIDSPNLIGWIYSWDVISTFLITLDMWLITIKSAKAFKNVRWEVLRYFHTRNGRFHLETEYSAVSTNIIAFTASIAFACWSTIDTFMVLLMKGHSKAASLGPRARQRYVVM